MSKLFRGNKYLINACAFCTCMFIIICLFISGINVLGADGDYNLVSLYNIEKPFVNDDFQSDDLEIPWFSFSSTNYSGYTNIQNMINNNLLSFPTGLTDCDYSFPYYYIGYSDYNSQPYSSLLPSGSFLTVVNDESGFCLYAPADAFINNNVSDGYIYSVYNNVQRYNVSTGFLDSSSASWSTVEIDGVRYARFYTGRNNYLAHSNLPIYPWTSFWNDPSSLDDLGAQVNPSFKPIGGENAVNNLYFQNPDWHFSNKSYSAPYKSLLITSDVVPDGNVSFDFNLTDYQKTASDLTLHCIFQFKMGIKYTNTGGEVLDFKNTQEWFGISDGSALLAKIFNYSVDIPINEYRSTGAKFTFDDLFSELIDSDNNSLKTYLLQMREIDSIEYYAFDLYCTANLSGDGVQGNNYTEWYNPMSKYGYTTDTSGTRNDYPYLGEYNNSLASGNTGAPGIAGNNGNYNSDFDFSNGFYSPSAGSSSMNYNPSYSGGSNNGNASASPSVNVSTGGVTVNTGSGLVDPKPVVDYVDNNLLPNTSDYGYVEKLEQSIDSNGFLQVMTNTFTFVPQSVWNDLAFYFNIFLGMLVGFFGLRLILDIL